MKNKKHVVFWSGGTDSTTVLLHLLKTLPQSEQIYTITLTQHPQLLSDQMQAEKEARLNFLFWADKNGHGGRINQTFIEVKQEGWLNANAQSVLWLGTLLPYAVGVSEPGSQIELYLGYCKNDEFWHRRQHYERAALGMAKVCDARLTLHYPLEWNDKQEIVNDLLRAGVGRDCFWTCERPNVVKVPRKALPKLTPCGTCPKCKELNAALDAYDTPPKIVLKFEEKGKKKKPVCNTKVYQDTKKAAPKKKSKWPKCKACKGKSFDSIGRVCRTCDGCGEDRRKKLAYPCAGNCGKMTTRINADGACYMCLKCDPMLHKKETVVKKKKKKIEPLCSGKCGRRTTRKISNKPWCTQCYPAVMY